MTTKRLSLRETPIGTKSRIGQAMDRLRQDGFEFAINSELRPIIVDPEAGYQSVYPIDSQEFEDLITCVWYELFTTVLQSTDFKFLLCVFREECRRGGKYLTEIEAEDMERNPIIQTILEFMNGQPIYSHSTAQLLFDLRRFLSKAGNYSEEEFPAFTSTFARQLRRLISVLAEYGVDVDIKHTERGSHTTLKRNAKFQLEAQVSTAMIEPFQQTIDVAVVDAVDETTVETAEESDGETDDMIDMLSSDVTIDDESSTVQAEDADDRCLVLDA